MTPHSTAKSQIALIVHRKLAQDVRFSTKGGKPY